MTNIAVSGIVLEPLTKDNYDNWSCLVRNYLVGNDLWDVILSSEISVQEEWNKKNAKALHIIQLACGSENLTEIRNFQTAKDAWNYFNSVYGVESKTQLDIEQGMGDDSLVYLKSLHSSIMNGEYANEFFVGYETAIYSTDHMGRSILHVAVIVGNEEIVKTLVKEGKDRLVNMQDRRGYTALALVAELTGNTNIAKYMVEKKGGQVIRDDQLYMPNIGGEIPVLLAAAKGHKDMTNYLYSITQSEQLADNIHALLFKRCINAEIFGVALSLIQRFPKMALAQRPEFNNDLEGGHPLYTLASMPYVFPSGSTYGPIQRFLYKILRLPKSSVAIEKKQLKTTLTGRIFGWMFNILIKISQVQLIGIREIYNQKMTHHQVLKILNCLHLNIQEYNKLELREASAYDAMLQASKHGIIEFVDAMRKANPDLLWIVDKDRRDIFSHAILNRRNAVFQLIHDATLNGPKEIIRCRDDAFGNSLLHLAGNLGPSSDHRRSGPALQMQREILWFKAVEAMVHPKCKEAKNADNKKPREIFTESHKELVKEGEKWAKETTGSFTLVATLITTIMFAAAFTVPGGYNQNNGIPIFLQNKIFSVFIIADAISLFTSSTAVVLFIGILTSRYAENDFLKSLPIQLLLGLIMLFLSVVSMMVSFCAALAMLLKGHNEVIIAAISFASIPIIVFLPSQLRLFIEIFKSTLLSNPLLRSR